MKFVTYHLIFLKRGPYWTDQDTPEQNALQRAHLSYLKSIQDQGKIVHFGPFIGAPDEWRGMTIFCTETSEEALTLARQDPRVIAGHFELDSWSWMFAEGEWTPDDVEAT